MSNGEYFSDAITRCNAALTALIGSGLPSFQFMFLGFIPKKKNEKFEVIKSALESDKTSIFYESPYRIKSTIELIDELEEDRDISIGRELTKKFEQIEHGLSSDLLKKMNDGEIKEKGEFVLITLQIIYSFVDINHLSHPHLVVLLSQVQLHDHLEQYHQPFRLRHYKTLPLIDFL